MSSFLEEMAMKNSPGYQQNLHQNEIRRRGDSMLNEYVSAVKTEVSMHYSKHAASGYFGWSGYDDITRCVFPESSLTEEQMRTCEHLIYMREPEVLSYVKGQLPGKIRELGITNFNLEYIEREIYVRNNRDLLSWNKWKGTGECVYIVRIDFHW